MPLSDRIKEIVKHILSMEPESYREMVELRPQLVDKGFSNQEVREALKLLESIWFAPNKKSIMDFFAPDSESGAGVLSEMENSALSDPAKAFLLLLLQMDMISEEQLHYIVERALYENFPPLTLENIQEAIMSFVHGDYGDYPDDLEDDDISVN